MHVIAWKYHQNICRTIPGQRSASQHSALMLMRRVTVLCASYLPSSSSSSLPHPYSPLPSSVPASRPTPFTRLSRLVDFAETAPKRRPRCGRTWRCVCANLCLCDFGWHKSSQRCPFGKESNCFGTFQPPPYRVWCVSLSTFFSLSQMLKTYVYSSDKSYSMKENENQTL